MTAPTTAPSEDNLKAALLALKADNPTLGVPKIHGLLTSAHPEWTVSEKRTRKVLQSAGLVQTSAASGAAPGQVFPTSRLIDGLDVARWTSKVEVHFFGKAKGKGLVAREAIPEGEVIWKEDPFVLAPEWEIYDMQMSSRACGHCSTLLTASALVVPCATSSSSTPCPVHFCSRLCLQRAGRAHPPLCASRNPASAPLLHFARRNQWMALHALAQATARVLAAHEADAQAFAEDWEAVRAMAQLGMEERAKGGWLSAEPDRAMWRRAHKLYVQAFREPATDAEKKRLAKLFKKPLPQDVVETLFEYEAFLQGLGRMSLNLEAHGGLYVLHSHLNHSCNPNVSVRHLDQRTALSRITLIARRPITPGEELLITYVNPDMPLEPRRRNLLEWGFGKCMCERCIVEEREKKERDEVEGENGEAAKENADLEAELKAGLGVM
ncbi:SET domain-containing protein [Epithele typhae]|uniref:SET domain-containing protein n=1 Tax=Epithele typhae TaxID=378194 RepID=UPI002007AE1E|nr:SET domain-containing protein [Epithele typhae]KAH9914053.1 SET domain-containing protein [Epithele typhae]